MGLSHPELLLFALPAAFLWWTTRTRDRITDILRLLAGACLVLALAGPYLRTSARGRDLVVVVDRSRSMPPEGEAAALELVELVEDERGDGDRVAVVSFGAGTRIDRSLSAADRFGGFQEEVDRDGSDLGSALEAALELLPEGRQGGLLLISDGENNGREALTAARRAFARGVRVDVLPIDRPPVADLSVERFELPGDVAVGEPFQFNVWVRADRRVESEFVLERGGARLSSGTRVFEPGLNRIVLRDVLGRQGIAEYELKLTADDDRVPENNRGLGAVRARGAAALLVLNEDGREDTLVRALRAARIPVDVATPEGARLDAVGLSAYRAVILENVAASRLARSMPALRSFVLDQGGGLLLTGGQASFGVGGYHLSPVEEVLPVTMELRQEHRKLSVALAIAMDRSGSMAAQAGGGMTKMDLANLGAVAAIELLSPMDSVAVIAVDSTYHIVQSLTPVRDVGSLTRRVRGIQSMGGGIFTYTALVAAANELEGATQLNRHITLFADAADSEEQMGCEELIDQFVDVGMTLSVIALGTEADTDADFLKHIARIGGGEAYFTQDPSELPRLFALDTLTAARSTFIDEPTGTDILPDLFGLGAVVDRDFPTLAGYNLAYLRPEAQAGIVTTDDYTAPIFAFQQQGIGRGAAYTGQIGGAFGAEVVAWPGFSAFFVTVARWLLGQEEPTEFFPTVRREGREAVIAVEVDAEATLPPDTSELAARVVDPSGETRALTLERTGEFTFEARTPLSGEGVALGSVLVGEDEFISLPPLALPYSPEFERSPDPERGARLLRRLARESGGEVGVSAAQAFRGERQGRLWRMITRELTLAALLLVLLEIAGRRLSLWSDLPRLDRVVQRAKELLPKRTRVAPEIPREKGGAEKPEATPRETAPPEARPSPTPATEGMSSALQRARRKAGKKLDR